MGVQVKHYTNNRNPNKHIEVRHYSDGHYSARQYMEWENGVKNILGSRTGRLFRFRKNTLKSILEDYSERVIA